MIRKYSLLEKVNSHLNFLVIRIYLYFFSRKKLYQINRLNLIYHIAPVANNKVWRNNLNLIIPHLKKFDRIVMGVVTGEGLVPVEDVQEYLSGYDIEWIIRDNDPNLGETVTFIDMLSKVASVKSDEATFYAHTKGVSRPDNKAIRLWYTIMYDVCLNNIDVIKNILRNYSCAGPFKKRGKQDSLREVDVGHFHYSGTFFWFRNDQLFSNTNWMKIRKYRYGVEEYPGNNFNECDAACIFGDYAGNLYDLNELRKASNCFVTMARIFGHPIKSYLSRSLS